MNWPFTVLREGEGEGGGGGTILADAPEPSAKGGKTEGAPKGGKEAPSATAEIWWDGLFRKDGSVDHGRLEHLPEEMKADKALLERFKKPDDFFKSYIHHAKLAREKGLTPLREGASDQEAQEHRDRLAKITGAPEKPEGYGIKRPENVPEEMWNEKAAEAFSQVFHKHAAPPGLVKEVVDLHARQMAEAQTAHEAQQAEAEAAYTAEQENILKQEFGAFRDVRIQDAIRGAKWAGLNPDNPIFKDANAVVAFAKVGSKIQEANLIDSGGGGGIDQGPNPQDELNAMAHDPAHKYYEASRNPAHAKHREAMAYRRKMAQLQAGREAAQRKR